MIADDLNRKGILTEIIGALKKLPWIFRLLFCALTFLNLGAYSQTQDDVLAAEANRWFEAGINDAVAAGRKIGQNMVNGASGAVTNETSYDRREFMSPNVLER